MNITKTLINRDEQPSLMAKLVEDVREVVANRAGGDNYVVDINDALRAKGYRLSDAGTMLNLFSMCDCQVIVIGATKKVVLK